MMSRQPLFLAQALQHYAKAQEKAILPRLVAPPVLLCFWLLLSMLRVSGPEYQQTRCSWARVLSSPSR